MVMGLATILSCKLECGSKSSPEIGHEHSMNTTSHFIPSAIPLKPEKSTSLAIHTSQSHTIVPLSPITTVHANQTSKSLWGICFSPYRANQNPDCGVFPTITEIREELNFIRNSDLSGRVRTYSCMGPLFKIPEMCLELQMECWPGAWLSRYRGATERELQALIAVGRKKLPNTPVLIVGNEVLLRNDLSEEELIKDIKRVKKETGLPVAYADVGGLWEQHPNVARCVDVIIVHLYPYWDGIAIDNAVDALLNNWRKLSLDNPSKRIVIGETGWPLAGEPNSVGSSYTGIVKKTSENPGAAVPSLKNQARYFSDFMQASKVYTLEYFYFSLFCESWKKKQEGVRGANWGLFFANGKMNPALGTQLPYTHLRQWDSRTSTFSTIHKLKKGVVERFTISPPAIFAL